LALITSMTHEHGTRARAASATASLPRAPES